jgi:cytoskeletal protein RodZ
MLPASLSDTALTFGGILGLAALVVGIIKVWNWIEARRRKEVEDAATSAMAKVGAVEIKADGVARDLAEFKIFVAREYPTNDKMDRVETRIDQGFSSMRNDLGELRAAMMQALTETRPQRPRRARRPA